MYCIEITEQILFIPPLPMEDEPKPILHVKDPDIHDRGNPVRLGLNMSQGFQC